MLLCFKKSSETRKLAEKYMINAMKDRVCQNWINNFFNKEFAHDADILPGVCSWRRHWSSQTAYWLYSINMCVYLFGVVVAKY